jgi:hypothetical protein
MKPMTERQAQISLITWFRLAHPTTLIFSIPNGAHLAGDRAQRARQMSALKAEGLLEGVPDLCICQLRPGEPPTWLEMKTEVGRLSPSQRSVHAYLRGLGHRVIVAYGLDDAMRQVKAAAA